MHKQLHELRELDELTAKNALRVRYLIKHLKNPRTDKRKLRIKKKEYIQWYQMIDSMLKTGIYKLNEIPVQTINIIGYYQYIYKHGYFKPFRKIRLTTQEKILFLHAVDNCFLIILADLGYYPNSSGTVLVKIKDMHPKQFEATVKKLQKQNYQLPNIFKPINLNIEEL